MYAFIYACIYLYICIYIQMIFIDSRNRWRSCGTNLLSIYLIHVVSHDFRRLGHRRRSVVDPRARRRRFILDTSVRCLYIFSIPSFICVCLTCVERQLACLQACVSFHLLVVMLWLADAFCASTRLLYAIDNYVGMCWLVHVAFPILLQVKLPDKLILKAAWLCSFHTLCSVGHKQVALLSVWAHLRTCRVSDLPPASGGVLREIGGK